MAKIIVENNRDFFNCSRAMDHKRLGVRMLLSMTLLLTSAFVRELCPVRVSFKQTILSHALTSSNAERKLSDPGEHLKEPIPLLAFFDNAVMINPYRLETIACRLGNHPQGDVGSQYIMSVDRFLLKCVASDISAHPVTTVIVKNLFAGAN